MKVHCETHADRVAATAAKEDGVTRSKHPKCGNGRGCGTCGDEGEVRRTREAQGEDAVPEVLGDRAAWDPVHWVEEGERIERTTNQCDGCQRGLPAIRSSSGRLSHGKNWRSIGCTADRYGHVPSVIVDAELPVVDMFAPWLHAWMRIGLAYARGVTSRAGWVDLVASDEGVRHAVIADRWQGALRRMA